MKQRVANGNNWHSFRDNTATQTLGLILTHMATFIFMYCCLKNKKRPFLLSPFQFLSSSTSMHLQ